MQTQTHSSRTTALLSLFDMHTKFFNSVLDGISDEDAHKRLDTKANHIAWLAGTLVHQRYHMANDAGTPIKQSGHELFSDHKGIQDGAPYPSLDAFRQDWQTATPIAREAIISLDDEKLDSEIDMGFMKMSFYEMLTFTIYREANCIGQIALWRRLLGYEAMKYD